jgi:hypothetical protein
MVAVNQISPIQLLLAACYGWTLGMMVNYLADVLPITRRISQPTCLYCAGTYSAIDYLLFRRCQNCLASRARRTWFVQAGFVVFMVLVGIFTLRRIDFWIASILITYLGLIIVIDMEYRVILNPVSLIGAVGGFGLGWHLNGLQSTVIGGVAGSC